MIAPSVLIGSSNLQITRTGIKSWTSSISCQIGLFLLQLHTLEQRKFFPYTYNGENVDMIMNYFWLDHLPITGNKDRCKISDKFKFRPHPFIYFGVACPLALEINVVDMTAPSVLVGSSWNLQVTRTGIKSWTNSNSSQIRILTSELLALSAQKLGL